MTFPKWYYYRGGVNDRKKIEHYLDKLKRKVTPERIKEICQQYEDLYLVNGHVNVTAGRLAANAYLAEMVEYYETAKDERSSSERVAEYIAHQKEMIRLSNEVAKGSKKSLARFSELAIEHEEQRQQYTAKPQTGFLDKLINEVDEKRKVR